MFNLYEEPSFTHVFIVYNADNVKLTLRKWKKAFWVEQCIHALFQCPEDVNEITKNHI